MNRRILLAWIAPLLAGAVSLPSTEQGQVRGSVVDRQGAPIADVQVYMVGDKIGSLSRETGTFVIANVPVGTYEIRAERLGFTIDSRLITVEEGAAVEVNFQLSEQAIGLPEIRSNGTRGAGTPSDRPATLRPAGPPRAVEGAPSFTPFTVKPEILNVYEVAQAMSAEYTAPYRDAGVAGTVILWFYVNADGSVANSRINSVKPTSPSASNEAALASLGLRIASMVRFTPPFNYAQKVAAWVQVPLTFVP